MFLSISKKLGDLTFGITLVHNYSQHRDNTLNNKVDTFDIDVCLHSKI